MVFSRRYSADGAGVLRTGVLDHGDRLEQFGEGTLGERLFRVLPLVLREGFESLFPIDPLRLVRKEHGVPVEGDADLARFPGGIYGGIGADQSSGEPGSEGFPHVRFVGGEEEIRAEGGEIRRDGSSPDEGRAADIEPVVVDRVEDPETGVRAVAGDDDDLGQITAVHVQVVQGFHKRKGGPGAQDLVFVLHLIGGIGVESLLLVDPVFFFEIEQRAGRDPDDELVIQRIGHGGPPHFFS